MAPPNRKLADEDRLDIARRIYHAMCLQYPDRLIELADQEGFALARSDRCPSAKAVLALQGKTRRAVDGAEH
jgi:hypothetical protein